jgi:PTS system nitrogen regulatory IIA component
MQFSSLLDTKLIYFEENLKSKDQILASMVNKICSHSKQLDCYESIYNKVIAREKESSTVYPSGIAVPHIRMEGYNDTVICICIPRHPVRQDNIDIKLFMLIITDNNSAKSYLGIVAAIMKMSKDKAFMDKLLLEKDGNDVYQMFINADMRVRQEVIIQDIMTTDPVVVRDTATLKEMGDLLGQHNITYLPVVDAHGNHVGDVNILQYLQVGVPDFLLRMENLDFLRSFENFEHLYEKESTVLVKDIMSKADIITYPTSAVIKVVFAMIQNKSRAVTVIDKKKVVGIVTAMDIFRKVVRG